MPTAIPHHLALPPRPLPGRLPEGLELFAVGDVHGRARALAAVLAAIAATPRVAGAERLVAVLGDLVDRGPDSLGAARLAMDAAGLARADRVVLLPGNHELMLLDALDGGDPHHWLGNGGRTVMAEIDPRWMGRPWRENVVRLRDALPAGFAEAVRAAPSHLRVGDLVLVHAGLDYRADDDEHLRRDRPQDDDHWAWIRHPCLGWGGGWDVDGETGDRWWGPTVVVHGHTVAVRTDVADDPDMLRPMDGVEEYRAICLDAGAASRPQVGWARVVTGADGGGVVTIAATRAEDDA